MLGTSANASAAALVMSVATTPIYTHNTREEVSTTALDMTKVVKETYQGGKEPQ